jgi:hypothetical protein
MGISFVDREGWGMDELAAVIAPEATLAVAASAIGRPVMADPHEGASADTVGRDFSFPFFCTGIARSCGGFGDVEKRLASR